MALDALDQAGVDRYIKTFFKTLGSKKKYVKVVGIHNYYRHQPVPVDRHGQDHQDVKRYNRSTDFWLTETGGLARLRRLLRLRREPSGQGHEVHVQP